ncbi:hypothetical protein GGF37_001203 [Kickxella alabastrina]|nr:hypothetical protein GGF37_001203 [Kickxella alabastrina]
MSAVFTLKTQDEVDALWAGEAFAPVFARSVQPALAVLCMTVGLVYAAKYAVTRRDAGREALYAAVASAALGLGAVVGVQALGLYL